MKEWDWLHVGTPGNRNWQRPLYERGWVMYDYEAMAAYTLHGVYETRHSQ